MNNMYDFWRVLKQYHELNERVNEKKKSKCESIWKFEEKCFEKKQFTKTKTWKQSL